ncbi:hypothetical protein [Mesorhizobium sp. M0898]|uniref:hypothetical protein n=1 Tax=Mesorhizobium sp. M0898 TaxID=2957020 RepID=UPI00333B4F99
MGGKLTVSRDILGCYVVTAETVRELYNHIAEFRDEPPEVTFEFSGGRKVSGKSLDDLLADSLVKSRNLVRIQFSAPFINRPAVDLILKADGTDAGSYRIHGERDEAIGLADTINNDLLAAKALYSRVSVHEYSPPSYSASGLFFLVAIGLLILGGLWAGDRVVGLVSTRALYAGVAVLLLAIPTYFFLFPAMTFNFGHGAKGFGARKWIVGTIFVAVVIAFIVAIGANFATDALKN